MCTIASKLYFENTCMYYYFYDACDIHVNMWLRFIFHIYLYNIILIMPVTCRYIYYNWDAKHSDISVICMYSTN